jgi:DNA invertase Pin-like site-specific DNA recombinase
VTPHHGKFVSYLRVSTKRQGDSGLGLEAQRHAVTTFLNGGNWQLIEEHVEVESGKDHRNRPALRKALEACKVYGATLVIAKLDRLSRDAHFLLGLQKSSVDFVAADIPQANRLTVGILALVAEQEREAISQRTKAALAAAKAKGKVLGQKKGYQIVGASHGARIKGAKVNVAKADAFAERLRPLLVELKDHSAANTIAIKFNRRGVASARGGQWTAKSICNLRKRLALMRP